MPISLAQLAALPPCAKFLLPYAKSPPPHPQYHPSCIFTPPHMWHRLAFPRGFIQGACPTRSILTSRTFLGHEDHQLFVKCTQPSKAVARQLSTCAQQRSLPNMLTRKRSNKEANASTVGMLLVTLSIGTSGRQKQGDRKRRSKVHQTAQDTISWSW